MVKHFLQAYRYSQKDFLSQKIEPLILLLEKLHQRKRWLQAGEIDIIGCRFPQHEF